MIGRVLIVATVPSMIGCFNMNNINILIKLGFKVDVACDFKDISVWPINRTEELKKSLNKMGVDCIQLDFSRNPLMIGRHISSYNSLDRLIKNRKYLFIHTHTPIASAIVRLAAHRYKTKVIYTAHGFHFYNGAPIKNWLLYYPIEKCLSKYTDVLITINKEDYLRSLKSFNAKNIVYVPGIGIDSERFFPYKDNREKIRTELKLNRSDIMLLSVGELNKNKNHESVIKSIKGLNLVYVIVGKGELENKLKNVAKECNVDLRLVGFRNDVVDFYNAADIYILPSIREGLNVSLMEAMACGLPCLATKIRGNVDLISNRENGYLFETNAKNEIRMCIKEIIKMDRSLVEKNNLMKIKKFTLTSVSEQMKKIYKNMGKNND